MQKLAITSLNDLKIAAPCSADWNAMTGDERVRHCEMCEKNVYNLSNMPEEEALAIVVENEGNLCGQLFLREDGTVILNDCPVGFGQVANEGRKFFVVACSAVVVIAGGWIASASMTESRLHTSHTTVSHSWSEFVSSCKSWYYGSDRHPVAGGIIMGDVCYAPPTTPPVVSIAEPPPPPLPVTDTSAESSNFELEIK